MAIYPNEKDAVFLGRCLAKCLRRQLCDVSSATLGRCHAVRSALHGLLSGLDLIAGRPAPERAAEGAA